MRKRVKCVIIRLPKLPMFSDDYFYSLLMAFLPHRNEKDMLRGTDNSACPFENAREAFIAKKEKLPLEFLESLTVLDEIENAVRFIRMSKPELDISMNPVTTETHEHDEYYEKL